MYCWAEVGALSKNGSLVTQNHKIKHLFSAQSGAQVPRSEFIAGKYFEERLNLYAEN